MAEKQVNLIQNLFVDIKKILEEMEIKDLKEANKYETSETNAEAQMWMDAYLGMDTYLVYRKYWETYMFQEVLPNVKMSNIKYWMKNPLNVPLDFRDVLLEKGRKAFLAEYVETNDYFRMLSGLPPYKIAPSEYVYLSASGYEEINSEQKVPIHELSYISQNLLLSTDEYKKILIDNPDKKYIRYIGKHKIDLFVARKAKDFEIIKYPDDRYDINSNLLREFKNLYNEYREYVMSTLYNDKFEDLYENYRTFMGLLIMSFALMQVSNNTLESILSRNFLDDSVIYTIISMYGIKKGTILSNKVRRNLVVNLYKLIKEKGTDDFYFDLIKILEYENINVSKLMLAKGQKFDEENNYQARFSNGDPINTLEDLNKINFPPYTSVSQTLNSPLNPAPSPPVPVPNPIIPPTGFSSPLPSPIISSSESSSGSVDIIVPNQIISPRSSLLRDAINSTSENSRPHIIITLNNEDREDVDVLSVTHPSVSEELGDSAEYYMIMSSVYMGGVFDVDYNTGEIIIDEISEPGSYPLSEEGGEPFFIILFYEEKIPLLESDFTLNLPVGFSSVRPFIRDGDNNLIVIIEKTPNQGGEGFYVDPEPESETFDVIAPVLIYPYQNININGYVFDIDDATEDIHQFIAPTVFYPNNINIQASNIQFNDNTEPFPEEEVDPNADWSIDSDPFFIKINILDKNPYDTITKNRAKYYGYHEIIDDDPTWWDTEDTRHILSHANYTIADTKYIMIDSVISQMQYLFESIYFPKVIIDNKLSTDGFKITIPELFGDEMLSLYDLMIFIMAATCMINNFKGDYPFGKKEDAELLAIAGFNFGVDVALLNEYLNTTQYIDKNKIIKFIDNLRMSDITDISRLYDDVIYPLREWIEYNLAKSNNKIEYLEYEAVYKALFTYDIADSFIQDFDMPIEVIRKKYNLSKNDINAYQHFYPHTLGGDAITHDGMSQQIRYTRPFLSSQIPVTWFVPVVINDPDFGLIDRGNIYFHDILNSNDIRTLTNESGDRILCDWEEDSWEINQIAVNELINKINSLSEDELNQAFFQVKTSNKYYNSLDDDSKEYFEKNESLPTNIRNYMFKNILLDKINMDISGLAEPPKSYLEYLSRKNKTLYNLLTADDKFIYDRESWLENIRTVINSLELALDVNIKYFEQSVIGNELFFKPLINLINRFKSTYVYLVKTGLEYVFADKIDSGGNSNLLKLFDIVKFVIHYVLLGERGDNSELKLYDVEHSAKYHINLNDRSQYLKFGLDEYKVEDRKNWMGSIHITDEAKFYKNGVEVDPGNHTSSWYSGEFGIGRWENDEKIIMQARYNQEKINVPIDYEAWKDFVEK